MATAALTAAIGSGCGGSATDGSAGTDAVVDAATVDIEVSGCGPQPDRGTGAVIDDDIVVTAAHVVAGPTSVELTDGAGTSALGEVVWFDPDLDVAAVRTTVPLGKPAPMHAGPVAADAPGRVGVIVDSRPVARPVTIVREVTIETTDITRTHDVRRSGYELAAEIDPGDSGAMVHTADGGIGIVWAQSTQRDGRAWAVRLPDDLLDPEALASLTSSVDTGECP